MAESSLYPTALDDTNIYEVVARLSSTLSADIGSFTTTIPITATTNFPTKGTIVIDNETIKYISVSVGSVDATGGRGHAGSAASHTSTTQVLVAVNATIFNKIRAGLIAVQTNAGTSGFLGTPGINARWLGGSTETQLNVGYLGGSTEGQLSPTYLGGSTEGQLNVDLVDGVEAAAMNQLAVAQVVAAKKTYDEGCVVHAPKTYTPAGAATATLDLSLGNNHEIQMPAGNITIAISNETDGQYFTVDITQDDPGSRTVTWFSTIKWAGGSEPTLTTAADKRDSIGFKVTGTDTYDGFVIGLNI